MTKSKRYTKTYKGKRYSIQAKSQDEFEEKMSIKMKERDEELSEEVRTVSFREGSYTHIGDVGELEALASFVRAGFDVSKPLTSNTKYDLIADCDGKLFKVQVKTIATADYADRMTFSIHTTADNHGKSRAYTTDEIDLIFLHCINPRWNGLIFPEGSEFIKAISIYPKTKNAKEYSFDQQIAKIVCNFHKENGRKR